MLTTNAESVMLVFNDGSTKPLTPNSNESPEGNDARTSGLTPAGLLVSRLDECLAVGGATKIVYLVQWDGNAWRVVGKANVL